MLHAIFLLYSVSAVCSKMASGYPVPSFGFVCWYGGALLLLGVYALVWQQVLKQLTLTTAFANKGATIVWGLLWGMLLFGESISLNMIIGAALVFVGILLVVASNE
jgi:drug/metabolite transporter (DMT)-like permease